MKLIKKIMTICLLLSVTVGMLAPLIFGAGEEIKALRCLLYANLSLGFLILNKLDD